MHNAFGVRNIRQQFIRRNCFYRVLTLYLSYRMTIRVNCRRRSSCPETRVTSVRTRGKYFASVPSEPRQTRFATAARHTFPRQFSDVYITSVSICSYSLSFSFSLFPPFFSLFLYLTVWQSSAATTEFYVLRGRNARAAPVRSHRGDQNKGKICKMIRVANSIASELED